MEIKFSYRAQGLVMREGRVLLQTPVGEAEYALPGGHIELGETAAEALAREFMEETGAAVTVNGFAWAEENFFTINGQDYQQVALTFYVDLTDALPAEDFPGKEPHLRFHWVPVEELNKITVYPPNLNELLRREIKHMVRREWKS